MTDEVCIICGDKLSDKYIQKLDCGHDYHYECILKSFINSKDSKNTCPYCRQIQDKLPIVNGLKKLTIDIHYNMYEKIDYQNIMCPSTLKSGQNKGKICNKNCKIGFNVCSRHLKK